MLKSFQILIDESKNKIVLSKKNFSFEKILDQSIPNSVLETSNFSNLHFTNVNIELSFIQDCQFCDCVFQNTIFLKTAFDRCRFTNCQFRNCNLRDSDFTEVVFDKCSFFKETKGSLIKAWFESCEFLETNFEDFKGVPLIQTSIVNCKFSKFSKSIEFKGEYFLIDLLQPTDGISSMFRK